MIESFVHFLMFSELLLIVVFPASWLLLTWITLKIRS